MTSRTHYRPPLKAARVSELDGNKITVVLGENSLYVCGPDAGLRRPGLRPCRLMSQADDCTAYQKRKKARSIFPPQASLL